MRGAIPPLPQYALMAWCSVKKQRDSFIFTFNFTTTKCEGLGYKISLESPRVKSEFNKIN